MSKLSTLAPLLVAVGLTATACGSSTSEIGTGPTTAPVTSLPRVSMSTAPLPADTQLPTPAPQDVAGSEVSEAPTRTVQRTAAEEEYLQKLSEGGVNIAGVEDALIGAADQVCRAGEGNSITPAVGGQLVEQKRTTLSPESAAALVVSVARATVCA